jgi:glutathione peroxidase
MLKIIPRWFSAWLFIFVVTTTMATPTSFFDCSAELAAGGTKTLAEYQGRVILVVNVASRCGYTKQYAGLEKLYRDYKDQGLTIIGFPSNEFGGQEPGTAEEIATFCKTKFDVTFPIWAKTMVKKTPAQCAVYQFLTATHGEPKWNFHKYLINRQGQVVGEFPSKVAPDSPELLQAIQASLH